LQRDSIASLGTYEEVPDLGLDPFRFRLRPGEPQQEVIGVPDVVQAPEVRVVGVPRGESPSCPHQAEVFLGRQRGAVVVDLIVQPLPLLVDPVLATPVVPREQGRLDELVERIEVDIGEDRRGLAPNNVAKPSLIPDSVISRTRLRPTYGHGWQPRLDLRPRQAEGRGLGEEST